MSATLNRSMALDDSFCSDRARGNRQSVVSEMTSISRRSVCDSSSTARCYRKSRTQGSSRRSSISEKKCSVFQNFESSSNEEVAESSRSPSPLGQKSHKTNRAKEKKSTRGNVFPSKGCTRYQWRKSQPWKSSLLNSFKHSRVNPEKDAVTQRILSARLHRIKELKNELYDQQRKLEAINVENKILKRLQLRHIKALGKFESTENDLHQLITRHNSEVRTLRGLLKKSQEQERVSCRKLKEADFELLKTKDNLHRLQKLSEDKSLEERDDLNLKLVFLTRQLEEKDQRIKGLQKHLRLNTTCFTRQLTAENRKNVEAQESIKKLQLDVLTLHQKLKEKERELDIKNIYANRMPKDLQKYECGPHQKGVNVDKAIQTESHMFSLAQGRLQDSVEVAHLPAEEKEELNSEASKMIQKEDNCESINEDLLKEQKLMEEQFELMERKKKEDQERDAEMSRELDRLVSETVSLTIDALQRDEDSLEYTDEASLNKHAEELELYTKCQRKNIPVRSMRRHYIFTEATENLHHGFPATGPISSHSSKSSTKYHSEEADSDLENLLGKYEPSFGKTIRPVTPKKKSSEGKERRKGTATLRDRKNSLMEELFGPDYSLKSNFSNPHARISDDDNLSPRTKTEHVNKASNRSPHIFYEDQNLTRIRTVRNSPSWKDTGGQTM